jgi:hypothetical protein
MAPGKDRETHYLLARSKGPAKLETSYEFIEGNAARFVEDHGTRDGSPSQAERVIEKGGVHTGRNLDRSRRRSSGKTRTAYFLKQQEARKWQTWI